jgi:hypothetical protein
MADQSSLKGSSNRFNIVSTAKCERFNRLQMEKHVFWDCKLYEVKKATMIDILSECRKSVKHLIRLEEKRFVQGTCYFINKIPKSL